MCNAGECVSLPDDELCAADGVFCNGTEYCDAVSGCLSTGDPCGDPLPDVCDESSTRCVDCLLPEVFPGTTYECGDTLSRTRRNVLRYQFDCPITLPSPSDVQILELEENGEFGADLTDYFDFSLEGTPGYETVLRVEEDGCRGGTCDIVECEGGQDDGQPCGQVFVNETWYAVINAGNWSGVADFKVTYASVYGDSDGLGGTGFNDLQAIYNNIGGPPCADDSRYDVDSLGCVGFNDIQTAYNNIPSNAPPKPTGHDCSGMMEMSFGGESAPVAASQSSAEAFVTWFPDFVSLVKPADQETEDAFIELFETMAEWAAESLSTQQRNAVADALADPKREFADPDMAEVAEGLAKIIAP